MTKSLLLSALILLATAFAASASNESKPRSQYPSIVHEERIMLLPWTDEWHKTHVLSFPVPENEIYVSAIMLVGKKNSREFDMFDGGLRPEGSLFCFYADYCCETKMFSIFLAEEPNCDEWTDDLSEVYEFENPLDGFIDGISPRFPFDDWFYFGYVPDSRKVDFMDWISVRLP